MVYIVKINVKIIFQINFHKIGTVTIKRSATEDENKSIKKMLEIF